MSEVPGTHRLRQFVLADPLWFLVLVLVAVVLSMSSLYVRDLNATNTDLRKATIAKATQQAVELAEARKEQLLALLSGCDATLRQYRDQYAAGNMAAVDATVQSALESFPRGAITHFSTIDAKGYLKFSTLGVNAPVYVGDRDYFRFHEGSKKDLLYINKPILARTLTGQWIVLLTRAIFRDGDFAGVAVMSISPGFISDSLANKKSDFHDVISLFFTDGTYLARDHDLATVLGTAIPRDRPFLVPGASSEGIFRVEASADKRTRIYAWARLEQFALIVNVGQDEATILGPVDAQIVRAQSRSAIGLILMLLLLSGVVFLLLRIRQQQQRNMANEAVLRATLDSTADGILVVGADGAILQFNHRFLELWKIPPTHAALGQEKDLLDFVLSQLSNPEEFISGVEALCQGATR